MSISHLSTAASPETAKFARDFLAATDQLNISRDLFCDLTPEQAIRKLREYPIDNDSKNLLLAAVEPLVKSESGFQLPLETTMSSGDYAAAKGVSLLLDMSETDLHGGVSSLLGVDYLQRYDSLNSSSYNFKCWNQGASGTLYGTCSRAMVTIPVSYSRGDVFTELNVHFIADSGGPVTEMSPSAFAAILGLAPGDVAPQELFFFLGGIKHNVRQCSPTGNHEDMPLLGVDFFKKIRAKLCVDYGSGDVRITGTCL